MSLAFWVVTAPLIAALLILLLPKVRFTAAKVLALLGGLVSLVLVLAAWIGFPGTPSLFADASSLTWFSLPAFWQSTSLTVNLAFGFDGLSLPLAALTAFVVCLAVFGARGRAEEAGDGLDPRVAHPRSYFFWISMAAAGILGVFSALDIFTFFVALEVTLFSSFFLIQLFGKRGSNRAATKFLIYRGFATVAMLVALVGIAYGAAGYFGSASPTAITFSIPQLLGTVSHASAAQFPAYYRGALFLVLLLAVFIEEAFVPFHTWLPTTHAYADTPTNMLIGGLLTKTGAYVLLRFGVGMLPDQVHRYGTLIAVFGVINILYGAFAAWAQKNWRTLVAFGSISHMGIVLLGIASMTAAGLQGAMFMIISSGLLTALLFYLTGAIESRTQTLDMAQLGGLSKRMPMLSGFLLVAALGSLGLPLTSGFISEIQAFIGGFDRFPALSFVGVVGLILSAVYLLYAIQKTTFGPLRTAVDGGPGFAAGGGRDGSLDATPPEYLPTVLMTLFVLLIGIYPNLLGHLFGLSVQGLLGIGG